MQEWEGPRSRVIDDEFLNVSLSFFIPIAVVSDVSLGKSIHHFISFSSLRMINSVDSPLGLKQNELSPK